MTALRRTWATRAVVRELLAADGEIHAYGISQATTMATGVTVPILHKLEQRGWLTSRMEAEPPVAQSRPRRYYQLTESGRAELSAWQDNHPNGVPL